MAKTYFKNLIRDIKKTFSRFISIVIIIAVGVAFYAGIRATCPSMQLSNDEFFKYSNFMDFKIISTLGLTEDDLSVISEVPGVSQAEGAFSMDAIIELNEDSLVVNVNSLPLNNGINKISLTKGRSAIRANEVVLEEVFMEAYDYNIGDEIVLTTGTDELITNSLEHSAYKIVGAAQSPLYISAQRQISPVGNGSVRGFVYLLPEAFKSDIFSEIYIRIDQPLSDSSLANNAEYKELAQIIEQRLEDIGDDRNNKRYDEVYKKLASQLKASQKELESAGADTLNSIAAAKTQLNQAQDELFQAEAQLVEAKISLDAEIAKMAQEIADLRRSLDEGQLQIELAKSEAAQNISTAFAARLAEMKNILDQQPDNTVYQIEYNSLKQIYEQKIKGQSFDNIYRSLEQEGKLDMLLPHLDLYALNAQFQAEQFKIDNGRKQLEQSEDLMQKAQQEARAQIRESELELQEARYEIEESKRRLREQEANANYSINKNQEEIQKNMSKLDDIEEPDWYVLGRSANVGYESYRQDSERIGNIGKVFPLIFFLVAALVSLTTMTRLVQENRTEIGTFKALGYSSFAIVSHYIIYSLTATLIGSLIGASIAFRLFPTLIMSAYSSFYIIPVKISPFNTSMALQASLLAFLFTVTAATVSTMDELRESPASLMRPKAPKLGKKILLERATLIWKRLKFTSKVTMRNIFRYKQRSILTIVGIAACTGLIITGFGVIEGTLGASKLQFEEIYYYDMIVELDEDLTSTEVRNIKSEIQASENVKSVLFSYRENGTVESVNSEEHDLYLVVPENLDEFKKYVKLSKDNQELIVSKDGCVITEKLAKLLDLEIGSTIEIKVDDEMMGLKVAGITEHYFSHFIYMSPEYYEKVMGEAVKFNSFYGTMLDPSISMQNITSKELYDIAYVSSASYKSNIHVDYSKSIDSINQVVVILIISAGVLTFVVIYNLTNININERKSYSGR